MRLLSSNVRTTLVIAALAASACREQTAVPATAASSGASENALVISKHADRVFAGGIAPPAERVTNTAAQNAKAADEGATLFTSMNCDGCHGGGAVGAVGPSLTDGRWRYGGADADIYRSIAEGRPKGMPSFGGVLQPAMIWRLVAYIKSLPPPKDAPTESW
ncbi:MAG TPA: c-type cytochrome [Gemmatimonadaceae bacterium]|jgi:cytochrome c oxidase cbb3-type subunit 3|nr:c-type cytochrome [Gemmatimonadaceae bacterium]